MEKLTFESVNQQIEDLDLDLLESNLNKEALELSSKICIIWKNIDGVLKLIAKFPFIPRKWREALNIFINTMDSICR